MQQRASTDGQHTAFTDHSIRRVPVAPQDSPHSNELVAFWPTRATDRDYALAYADESWTHTDPATIKLAHDKLQNVWTRSPGDPAVAAQLAYTCDLIGDYQKAESLYREALKADPANLIALSNLGTHLARNGNLAAANELWQKALAINPGLEAPARNLATSEYQLGHEREALDTVQRSLSLNPDSAALLKLQKQIGPIK